MTIETEIAIAGTGPVGLMAAKALAQAGFGVALIGPPANLQDQRTTALMKPSLDFLASLGVLDELSADAAPLRSMRIVDATSRLIRSTVVTFRAAEIGEDAFGLNIPNRYLLSVLERAAAAEGGVNRIEATVDAWLLDDERAEAVLGDGRTVSARLVVAADGRRSLAREAARIRVRTSESEQSALVLNFGHSRDHHYVSTEFHTEDGPFTQVPLPGQRSSLVWVMRPHTASEVTGLGDAELSLEVERRMQSMLGRVTVEPGRQVYPLSSALPDRFARNRVALVGEAAHVFPPIGAQGLNLGVRDIVQLVDAVSGNAADPGSPGALAAYDLRRRPDILARASAVELLNRSLLSDFLPAQIARSAGLSLLGSLAPLRALFMREGLRTGSGFASLFGGLGSAGHQHTGLRWRRNRS
jgi:2-octaprenyl-6-methoxyphenol hydroxylase